MAEYPRNRADLVERVSSAQEPNAFQDLAADLWGPPKRPEQSGTASISEIQRLAAAHDRQQRGSIVDNSGELRDSLEGIPRSEVMIKATVQKILPDDNNGLKHQRFIIKLGDGTNVFVAHSITAADRIPIKPGSQLTLKGEWIPEPRTNDGIPTIGVLHWTHASENERKHPSGWIELDGKRYG